MTIDNATRNLAGFAQMRLDMLAECQQIRPVTHMDMFLCENDRFILRRVNGGWRHSEAEIRAMRSLASEGAWPTPTVARDLDGLVEIFAKGSGRSQDYPR